MTKNKLAWLRPSYYAHDTIGTFWCICSFVVSMFTL